MLTKYDFLALKILCYFSLTNILLHNFSILLSISFTFSSSFSQRVVPHSPTKNQLYEREEKPCIGP